MNRYIRVDLDNLAILLLSITIFTELISFIPGSRYLGYAILAFLALYIIINYKYAAIRYDYNVFFFFAYLASMIITSYYNIGTVTLRNPFLSALFVSVKLIVCFFTIMILIRLDKWEKLISVMFWLVFVICVVTDILAFFIPPTHGNGYLIGNKFSVSYLHLEMLVLYHACDFSGRGKKVYDAFFTLFSVIFIFRSGCGTGLFGIVLFLTLFYFTNHKIVSEPLLYVVCTVVCASFIWISRYFINTGLGTFIITELFKKDITLTGRTVIYENLPLVIYNRFFMGYGYGSNYEICMKSIGAVNAQNGYIRILMETGFISLIFIMIYVITTIRKMHSILESKVAFPIECYILVMMVQSAVEIRIDTKFIISIIALSGVGIFHSIKGNNVN